MLFANLLAQTLERDDVFGKVEPPKGVDAFNMAAGNATEGIGALIFISSLIRIATVVAGIWILFNFISAGYLYITNGGESSTANKVRDQITSSVLGLIIIVGAYTIVALISFFLFGDAGYILNPKILTPQDVAAGVV